MRETAKPQIILRRWTSRIHSFDEDEYLKYVRATGFADYSLTAGNIGAQILFRSIDEGMTQVTTLSWWNSLDDIRTFAGDQPEVARYYPDDDHFLVDRPTFVEHHRVVASSSDRFAAMLPAAKGGA